MSYSGYVKNTLKNKVIKLGSVGRTRTYDQPVTLILKLLLGMDYIISIILSNFRSEALRALNFSELLPCGIVSTPAFAKATARQCLPKTSAKDWLGITHLC